MGDDLMYIPDAYVTLQPGYHLRGDGSWLPRAGYIDTRFDSSALRGGGFFDKIKGIAQRAWQRGKKFIFPFLKKGGSALLQAVANKAKANAGKYVDAFKQDRVHGLVGAVMNDMGPVIKDTVINQIKRGGTDALSPDVLAEMYEGGFPTTIAGVEGTVDSIIANSRPLLLKILEPITVKLQLIANYVKYMQEGHSDAAENEARKLFKLIEQTNNMPDSDEKQVMRLGESLIHSALQAAELTGKLNKATFAPGSGSRGSGFMTGVLSAVLPQLVQAGTQLLGQQFTTRGKGMTEFGHACQTIFPGSCKVGAPHLLTEEAVHLAGLERAGALSSVMPLIAEINACSKGPGSGNKKRACAIAQLAQLTDVPPLKRKK
jgi:hypothetical protein